MLTVEDHEIYNYAYSKWKARTKVARELVCGQVVGQGGPPLNLPRVISTLSLGPRQQELGS